MLYSEQAPLSQFYQRPLYFEGSKWQNFMLGASGYDRFGNQNAWGKAKGTVLPALYGVTGAVGAAALGINPAVGAKVGSALGSGINGLTNLKGQNMLEGTDGEDAANQAATASAAQSNFVSGLVGTAAQGVGGFMDLKAGQEGLDKMLQDKINTSNPTEYNKAVEAQRLKKQEFSRGMAESGLSTIQGLAAWQAYPRTVQPMMGNTRFMQFKDGGVLEDIALRREVNPASLVGFEDTYFTPTVETPLPTPPSEMTPRPVGGGGVNYQLVWNRLSNAEGSSYSAKNNVGPGHYGRWQMEPALIKKYANTTPEQFLKSPKLQDEAMMKRLVDLEMESRSIKASTGTQMSLEDVMVGTHFKGMGRMKKEVVNPRLMYQRTRNNPSTADYIYNRSYGRFAGGGVVQRQFRVGGDVFNVSKEVGYKHYDPNDATEDFFMVDKEEAKRLGVEEAIKKIAFGEARYGERIFDQDSNLFMSSVFSSPMTSEKKAELLGKHVLAELASHPDTQAKQSFQAGGQPQPIPRVQIPSQEERRRNLQRYNVNFGWFGTPSLVPIQKPNPSQASDAKGNTYTKLPNGNWRRTSNNQEFRYDTTKRQFLPVYKSVGPTDRNYRTGQPTSTTQSGVSASGLATTGLPMPNPQASAQPSAPSWYYPNVAGDMDTRDAQAKIAIQAQQLGIKLPSGFTVDGKWGSSTNAAHLAVLQAQKNRLLAEGKSPAEAERLATINVGVAPKIGRDLSGNVGLVSLQDPSRIKTTPNPAQRISTQTPSGGFFNMGIPERNPSVPVPKTQTPTQPTRVNTGLLEQLGQNLPDIGRIAAGLLTARANQPKAFELGPRYDMMMADLENRANQGLTPEQRSRYANQLNQGFAQGVGAIRNLTGGGANQGAIIAGLGRLSAGYNQGLSTVEALDAQARDANRMRYQSAVLNDLGIRQSLFGQQEAQKAMNRQGASQLIGASVQNMSDRNNYNNFYGPNSAYAKLQQSMVDQTNSQNEAAKAIASYYGRSLGMLTPQVVPQPTQNVFANTITPQVPVVQSAVAPRFDVISTSPLPGQIRFINNLGYLPMTFKGGGEVKKRQIDIPITPTSTTAIVRPVSPLQIQQNALSSLQQQVAANQPTISASNVNKSPAVQQYWENQASAQRRKDVALKTADAMAMGSLVPTPITQAIGAAGAIGGSLIRGQEVVRDVKSGNYTNAAMGAVGIGMDMAGLGKTPFGRAIPLAAVTGVNKGFDMAGTVKSYAAQTSDNMRNFGRTPLYNTPYYSIKEGKTEFNAVSRGTPNTNILDVFSGKPLHNAATPEEAIQNSQKLIEQGRKFEKMDKLWGDKKKVLSPLLSKEVKTFVSAPRVPNVFETYRGVKTDITSPRTIIGAIKERAPLLKGEEAVAKYAITNAPKNPTGGTYQGVGIYSANSKDVAKGYAGEAGYVGTLKSPATDINDFFRKGVNSHGTIKLTSQEAEKLNKHYGTKMKYSEGMEVPVFDSAVDKDFVVSDILKSRGKMYKITDYGDGNFHTIYLPGVKPELVDFGKAGKLEGVRSFTRGKVNTSIPNSFRFPMNFDDPAQIASALGAQAKKTRLLIEDNLLKYPEGLRQMSKSIQNDMMSGDIYKYKVLEGYEGTRQIPVLSHLKRYSPLYLGGAAVGAIGAGISQVGK